MSTVHEPGDDPTSAGQSGLWLEWFADGRRTPLSPARCLAVARAVLEGGSSGSPGQAGAAARGSPAHGEDARLAEALRSIADAEPAVRGEPRTPEAELLLAAVSAAVRHRGLQSGFEKAVAEARLEAVRELAYGAGHEINNPLANIAARAQSLLPGERDPERRRRLSAIADQAFRARDMIGGLMVFARPPRPQPADVPVETVVRPAVESMRAQALARGIRLEYAPPPRPITVRVDATQVGEVVRMLAVNAIEAVEPGGSVRVEVARNPAEPSCRLVIVDDGRGMDADVARRACDPFFSGREAGRGIGLGLPKALRLVEASGGALAVESRPGVGTTVTVTLPLAEDDGVDAAPG